MTRTLITIPFLIALATTGSYACAAASTPTATASSKQGNFYMADEPLAAITSPTGASGGSFSIEESYQIKNGDKIADILGDWCTRNGWTLSWGAADIVAEADADISGSFETAVELLLDALNRGGAKIHATYYDANRVLRIGEKAR